ncbi:MAG: OmpW family outer membrane protein [Halieaceae bacterium]|jgi:outer membrane protein|nr:OmpW family outer membrane protein [Halieaceae bacterium]
MRTLISLAAIAAFTLVPAAQAVEKGDWIVRVGPTNVYPDASSDAFDIAGLASPTVDVDDAWALGGTVTYMFSNAFGVELLAATPFQHDITVDGANVDAGTTEHLPPTLTFMWYPRGGKQGWQPYLGVGVNYTTFFSEDVDNELEEALGLITQPITGRTDPVRSNLRLDDSWGVAARVGVDIPFSERWSASASMWWMDIGTEAEITNALGTFKADVDIDPFVYMIGLSYSF